MRTTICAKIQTHTLHGIDAFCKKNKLNRSQYMKKALLIQLKRDKIDTNEQKEVKREIKSKIVKT